MGGMGEVYLAVQLGLGRFQKPLALKLLLPHLSESPQAIQMFLDEAQLAARMNHPNVVQIFDVGVAEGRHYIAMELVRGVSLSSFIHVLKTSGGRASGALLAYIGRALCDGLHHAHELMDPDGNRLEVVHRDVTPHNVLCSMDGEVKLTDFGIAKARDSANHTRPGYVKGKFEYVAPEQLLGKPLTRRVDIFGAGLTLYHLATLGSPFRRENELATLHAIERDPLPSLAMLRSDLPRQVREAITKATHKDPNARFATARAFRDALPPANPEAKEELAQLVRTLCKDQLAKLESKTAHIKALEPSTRATDPEEKRRGTEALRPARGQGTEDLRGATAAGEEHFTEALPKSDEVPRRTESLPATDARADLDADLMLRDDLLEPEITAPLGHTKAKPLPPSKDTDSEERYVSDEESDESEMTAPMPQVAPFDYEPDAEESVPMKPPRPPLPEPARSLADRPPSGGAHKRIGAARDSLPEGNSKPGLQSRADLPAASRQSRVDVPAASRQSRVDVPAASRQSRVDVPAASRQSRADLPAENRQSRGEHPAASIPASRGNRETSGSRNDSHLSRTRKRSKRSDQVPLPGPEPVTLATDLTPPSLRWRWCRSHLVGAILLGVLIATLLFRKRDAEATPSRKTLSNFVSQPEPPLPKATLPVGVPSPPSTSSQDAGLSPPAEPQESPSPSPAIPPGADKMGFLNVHATPWANVFVRGKHLGRTPISQFPVEAGMVPVTLVNPETRRQMTQNVLITVGKDSTVEKDLR